MSTDVIETESKPNVVTGIVLFIDGGSRPNPGFTGWGTHGYKYETTEPKKGAGLIDQVLTENGYISKSYFQETNATEKTITQVTPIKYYDGFGSFSYTATNNLAELTAAIESLIFSEKEGISKIRLVTDSEYVVRGTNEYLDKWRDNGWMRQDRSPIANKEVWERYDSILTGVRSKGIKVELVWIKGHNGHFGNELADKHATIGVIKARNGEYMNSIESSDPEGYWKYKVTKHPFISHRRMYFNTLLDFQIPGQYYLGEHGTDDDLLGKKSSDGAFAFIAVHEPDPILEMVRNYQSNISNNSDTFIMMRLDFIFNPNNHKDLVNHKHSALSQDNPLRLDLFGLNREPITRELRPAKLAIRAIEALSDLSERLVEFSNGNSTKYTSNNITESFFNITEIVKKGKEPVISYKLKENIVVGLASLEANVKYEMDGEIKEKLITLAFNIDLPNRNSIKHMETLQPKIEIITWKESERSFRYATVITTEHDKGIWAGVYSNLIVIND